MIGMRFFALRGLASVGLMGAGYGAFSYFGAGPADKVYPLEPTQVYQTLTETAPPKAFFGHAGIDGSTLPMGDGSVVWAMHDSGQHEILRFTATVTRVDKGTRVHVEVSPPAGEYHDRIGKGLAGHAEIATLYRAAMSEQIDARLNHRDFDMTHISRVMMAAALANISQFKQQMDKDVQDSKREHADNIARAYDNEARGHAGGWVNDGRYTNDTQAGEPLVDPDPK
jgi:hypothetical protein